ncbi:MAG: alginate lyase family protein [Deltaproteobacteria bacterium]|nr:alginate lyase family protein [Deltaproteobacteria bacterium]
MSPWIFNRLRLMPFPEIGLRLYRKIRVKIWEILLPLTGRKFIFASRGRSKPPRDLLGELPDRFPVRLDPEFRTRYERYFPPDQVMKEGETLVKGKIPVFNGIYDFGEGVPDWHRDPQNPVPWPKVFFSHLDHNDLRYGRLLNVWEVNRQFYFYDLGKAYYLTHDERFAQTLLTHLKSWIDENPVGIGINWFSPMENGLRMISWLWGLFFILDQERSTDDLSSLLPQELRQKILTSIYWQTTFIEKNLSKYSSANNHRIGEALGLFWVGSLLPGLRRSKKWRKKGWKILCQEIEIQIFPDGVPREQSTRYLFYVFDLYTLALLLARKENLPIPRVLWDRLEKICEYVMAQMDEGGNLPDLGDSSDGLACKLHTDPIHPYRSLLTTGAAWFKRGDFKLRGGRLDERNFWLGKKEDLEGYEKVKEELPEQGSRVFSDGGQVVLRKGRGSDEAVLSLDAGPFGFLSIAAHAHADALSFTLSLGGKPVLIDPGTYLYHDGGAWRDYFRGTRAHNTIEIDGLDQGQSGGPFMWLTKPETGIREISIGPDRASIRAFHQGYERLPFPVHHERSILWDCHRQSWTILDRLETQGPHTLREMFHFHPQCRVRLLHSHLFEISIDEPILFLELDNCLQVSLHCGQEDPIRGWYSFSFGEKVPASTLVGEMTIRKMEILQTVLRRP